MTFGELKALARLKLDDVVEPYLWSDQFISDAINRAQDEAIVRMGGIGDDYTTSLTQAVVRAGFPLVPLDASVYKVESVQTGLQTLTQTTAGTLATTNMSWELDTGVPAQFLLINAAIRVYPTPLLDTPIIMSVRRGALHRLLSDQQKPEVPFPLHAALLHWVLSEAYMLPDSDISNPNAVELHTKAFDGIFGPAPTAKFLAAWGKTPARTSILMRRM